MNVDGEAKSSLFVRSVILKNVCGDIFRYWKPKMKKGLIKIFILYLSGYCLGCGLLYFNRHKYFPVVTIMNGLDLTIYYKLLIKPYSLLFWLGVLVFCISITLTNVVMFRNRKPKGKGSEK